MSKVANLQASVLKAHTKVEKCKATIARHEKALAKKVDALEKISGRAVDISDIDSYKWNENGKSYSYYWEACEVASKLDDIKGAKRKLRDAEIILGNWEAKLQKEIDKDDFISTIPQALKDFLESWKQKAYDWHIQRYEKFVTFKEDLYKREAEAIDKFKNIPYRERWAKMEELGLDNISRRLLNFGGTVIVKMNEYRNEAERLAYLDRVLEDEKRRKAIDLINRINDVVGEITDASNLKVNDKLNLDGIIQGTKANAKVETIGAGGYNIQCFHYRTLVHEVK